MNDRRAIFRADLVDRVFQRLVVRLHDLPNRHLVYLALALFLVTPARAEFTSADSITLQSIEYHVSTFGTKLDAIAGDAASTDSNTAYIANLIDPTLPGGIGELIQNIDGDMATLIGHVDGLESLITTSNSLLVTNNSILTAINLNTSELVTLNTQMETWLEDNRWYQFNMRQDIAELVETQMPELLGDADTINSTLASLLTQMTSLSSSTVDYTPVLNEIRNYSATINGDLAYLVNILDGSTALDSDSPLQKIIQHVDELEALIGTSNSLLTTNNSILTTIAGQSEYLDDIANYLDLLNPKVTTIQQDVAQMLVELQAIVQNTEPGDAGVNANGPVFALRAQVNPGNPVLPAVVAPGDPTLAWSDPGPDDFVGPAALEAPTYEWTEPTRTGQTSWGVNIPLASLGTYFGIPTSQTISLTTDLSWFGGTLRSALHGAIIAIATFFVAWWIFDEFKRTG